MRHCGLRPPQGLSRVTSERERAQAVCSGCCHLCAHRAGCVLQMRTLTWIIPF